MNKQTVVVWDWNGTIVDDAFVFVDIMNGYLKEKNLKTISLNDYKQHFCFPVINYYKKLGFALTDQEFIEISRDFINRYKKQMFKPSLKFGIIDVLNYLKKEGCVQLLVSAQEQGLLNRAVSYYGLDRFFFHVGGLNNNLAKSKKTLAANVLNCVELHNKKVVFIGDTLHDYDVAFSLESSCCLVSWGHNSKNILKKSGQKIVDNTNDLMSFFTALLNS